MSRGCYETGPHLAGRQLIRAALPPFHPSTLPERDGQEREQITRRDLLPGRTSRPRFSVTRPPGCSPRGQALSLHRLTALTAFPPTGLPHPPPRAQRSPGAQPALTSSMSRSRMLGGCGVPLAPSTATLITCSSRHRIAAATAAMATVPGAAGPGPAAGTGRAAFPAGRRGGARPAE